MSQRLPPSYEQEEESIRRLREQFVKRIRLANMWRVIWLAGMALLILFCLFLYGWLT